MTSADILNFLADLARAIAAGLLAVFFVALAVASIVWSQMRARARARRNLEALRVDVTA